MFSKNRIRVAGIRVGNSELKLKEVSLTKANILAMNATPVSVVAAPGAGFVLEFLGAVLIYDFATAGYGGGGDVTIRYGGGGTTLSTTVTAANSFGAAADRIANIKMLDTAGGVLLTANTALVITNATGAFTDAPSNGVGRLKIHYAIHKTGL